MFVRIPHIESDKVSSGVCVVTSILLLGLAIFAMVEFGEYVLTQIASLF